MNDNNSNPSIIKKIWAKNYLSVYSEQEWGSKLSQLLVSVLVPGSLTLAGLWIPVTVRLRNNRNSVVTCTRHHQREMQVGCALVLKQREKGVMLLTSPNDGDLQPLVHSSFPHSFIFRLSIWETQSRTLKLPPQLPLRSFLALPLCPACLAWSTPGSDLCPFVLVPTRPGWSDPCYL